MKVPACKWVHLAGNVQSHHSPKYTNTTLVLVSMFYQEGNQALDGFVYLFVLDLAFILSLFFI